MADSLRIARLSDVHDGENVAVFGMGIIGLGVLQAYRAMGKKVKLIAVDTSNVRLKKALQVGRTMWSRQGAGRGQRHHRAVRQEQDRVQRRRPQCSCRRDLRGLHHENARRTVLQTALDLICDRNRTNHVLRHIRRRRQAEPAQSDLQATEGGSAFMGYDDQDVSDALAMMADGRIDRASLVTHQFPLERAAEAFQAQDNYADSSRWCCSRNGAAAQSA